MIRRIIDTKIIQLAGKFPVVSITGPRQSGKTTLIKSIFKDYRYESLEDPSVRLLAHSDPLRFLGTKENLVIDEIQRVPELFSYIQTTSDAENLSGRFIISGSQSFLLNQQISQSLAGRVAILNLLPLSLKEMSVQNLIPAGYDELIYRGFYPRIYDKEIDPVDYYPNYLQTYIERDVRLLQNIHDLNLFVRFVKLCAGRTGQLMNLTSLAGDCSISVNTAKAWLSVLESSYIVFLLQPHFRNFNKRLVKSPKLYFTDTGLACSLLDIRSESQLQTHYLRGALFENLVITELLKARLNQGLRPNLYFWRDSKGMEIDCLIEEGDELTALEIKSGSTYSQDFFRNLNYWNKLSGNTPDKSYVIYGGDDSRMTEAGSLLSWKELDHLPI